jgi:hypothetical protein
MFKFLSELWIEFAKDTHLLDQDHSGKWVILDKGRSWIEANKVEKLWIQLFRQSKAARIEY